MQNEKEGIVVSQSMMLFFGVIILGLVGFCGYLYGKVGSTTAPLAAPTQQAAQQAAAPTITLDAVKALFTKDFVKFGDANRKVLFVEISDPSCPYCHIAGGKDSELAAAIGPQFKYATDGGTYIPPVSEIRKLVDAGKASYLWIYFPGHSGGEMAAKAMYCANDLGKFWEVSDLLMSEKGYEIQNGVSANRAAVTGPVVGNDKTKSGDLANFLKSAVDPVKMKACLDSGKYDGRTVSETSEGQKLAAYFGQNFGTPAFFVNTQAYAGAYSFTEMQSTVDAALK